MFVHLHVHSDYSLLHSCISISELTRTAAAAGIESLALVDIDTMAGAVEFHTACEAAGVRPIFGLELSVQHESCVRRLVLLAETSVGYRNLLWLASQEGPVTMEDLQQAKSGLIALTGSCWAGWFSDCQEPWDEAGVVRLYRAGLDLFGCHHWYVQVEVDSEEKRHASQRLLQTLEPVGAQFTGAQEGCLLHAHQEIALHCMQQLQTTAGSTVSNTDERLGRSWRPLAKPSLLTERLAPFAHAASSTEEIAARCQVTLTLERTQLPTVESHCSLLEAAKAGLRQRSPLINEEHAVRLQREYDIITEMGFTQYFFIVADIVRFAREQGIPVGPGRGSAAGSLTAYALGITDVNPLDYGLMFERFLNPNRVSPPDIDLDFCAQRRDEVVQYVLHHYGRSYAAQIGTYGTFGIRAALRDAAKVLDVPETILHRCLELGTSSDEAPPWDIMLRRVPEAESLIRAARGLYGRKRSLSIHAAGIVVAKEPLLHYTSLRYHDGGYGVTHMDMDSLQKLGLLKIDILGLRTLTLLHYAEALIRSDHDSFQLNALDLDDSDTYDYICRADTFGIFQLESALFQDVIGQLEPRSFADLIALLAVGRPGPLQFVPALSRRRRGEEIAEPVHPLLAPVVAETHGLMLYQEQVMQAAHVIGGLSLAAADELRAAMSKKQPQLIQQFRQTFVQGAATQGMSVQEAQTLFAHMERFGGYAFNKSHSASYARISFQCAYLKQHYPAAFFAALLHRGDHRNARRVLVNALQNNVEVLPPDLAHCAVESRPGAPRQLRLGLSLVKGLNKPLLAKLEQAIANGGSPDLQALMDRWAIPQDTIIRLLKAGALDYLGERSALWQTLQQLTQQPASPVPTAAQWAQWEHELFGIHVVYHPASDWSDYLEPFRNGFDRVEAGRVLQLDQRRGSWQGCLHTPHGAVTFHCSQRPPQMNVDDFWALLGSEQQGILVVETCLPLTRWLLVSPTAEQVNRAASLVQEHSGALPVILALDDTILHLADRSLWADGSAQLLQALTAERIAHRMVAPPGWSPSETSKEKKEIVQAKQNLDSTTVCD